MCVFILFFQEREKLKEEKKKYAERLKLWSKPREDMECDDLKVGVSLCVSKCVFACLLCKSHVSISFIPLCIGSTNTSSSQDPFASRAVRRCIDGAGVSEGIWRAL